MYNEYITPELLKRIKEDNLQCQISINQAGPLKVWKPDLLSIPRWSYLGQLLASKI